MARPVRGPVMATRDVFNRKRQRKGRTGGIGFVTTEPQSWRERLTIKYSYGPMVRIPAEDEPRHMLLEGNTGGGKSAAVRQLAVQIAGRDETAIIYDQVQMFVRGGDAGELGGEIECREAGAGGRALETEHGERLSEFGRLARGGIGFDLADEADLVPADDIETADQTLPGPLPERGRQLQAETPDDRRVAACAKVGPPSSEFAGGGEADVGGTGTGLKADVCGFPGVGVERDDARAGDIFEARGWILHPAQHDAVVYAAGHR
jgi:hypothetical protein